MSAGKKCKLISAMTLTQGAAPGTFPEEREASRSHSQTGPATPSEDGVFKSFPRKGNRGTIIYMDRRKGPWTSPRPPGSGNPEAGAGAGGRPAAEGSPGSGARLSGTTSPPPLCARLAGAAARYLSMTEATSCGNSFISKAE